MPTDTLNILDNSHDILSLTDIDAALTEKECHKYKVSYSNPCTIEGVTLTPDVYLDCQFLNLIYEEQKEVKANRDGENKKLYHRITPVFRFEFIGNDFFFHTFNLIGLHQTIMVSPINPGGSDYEVEPDSWTVERVGEDDLDTYGIRVTFKVKDSSFISKACCESESIVVFEDPCDIDGGGGGGGIEDVCEDFEVSITYDGTSLTAETVGGPVGASNSYEWFYDAAGNGVFTKISEAMAFNAINPGIYRVYVTRGTCRKSSDYELNGECMDFAVNVIEVDGHILIADVNRISTFQWYKDDVAIPGATQSYYVATESGTYKVEATSIGCVEEDSTDVTVTVCAHSVNITELGGLLTAVVTGNTGDPVYQWYVDYGDGAGTQPIDGATGSTYQADLPGCYQVKVTADGCDKYATKVILDECTGFNVIISGVVNTGLGSVDLTAEAVNPPGTVTYTWFQVVNGVYQQIGTGQSINTQATGNVKVEASSNDCRAEDMLFFCVDPDTVENYQSFIGDGLTYQYVIDNFTLPNPSSYTSNEINGMLLVLRNGLKMQYSTSPTSRTQFQIDFANNRIVLDSGFPLKSTERLEALLVTP